MLFIFFLLTNITYPMCSNAVIAFIPVDIFPFIIYALFPLLITSLLPAILYYPSVDSDLEMAGMAIININFDRFFKAV
ncbi:hypothetical protein [Sphingobacterium multivorum]|uniref:hypothetical protein n=1 Tax=Sphingobacterium multivorum TaxID=28454 RepID=UPI003DA5885D